MGWGQRFDGVSRIAIIGLPTPAEPDPPVKTVAEPPEIVTRATTATIVDKPLRSGQRIHAAGDLIVLGLVSHGAEIIAGGNIHVYAPLRGRALAGVHGDRDARIFCTCMEPELYSIAGFYRTVETEPCPTMCRARRRRCASTVSG